jgi:hypothetical protein
VPTVTLSDGAPCEVRQLGLYALDVIEGPAVSGPFIYQQEIAGIFYDAEFDIFAFEEPPKQPEIPEHEAEEKSLPWYDWKNYRLYQAGLEHERKRLETTAEYIDRIVAFILDECITEEDRKRLLVEDDWKKIYTAALVEQLTEEKLVDTLRKFKAEYSNKEIFEALREAEGSPGKYDAIRVWEGKLMIEMGLTEAQYSMLSLDERARKVCSMMLPKWMEHLEIDRTQKESEAKK